MPGNDPAYLPYPSIKALRSQGVGKLAQVIGVVPGHARPLSGGISTILGIVRAIVPDHRLADLLAAIAWCESKGDHTAISVAGALGPYQLTSFLYDDPTPINPFQWGAATRRAAEVFSHYLTKARTVAPGQDPYRVALQAWKEGWRGRLDPHRQQRANVYADQVLGELRKLQGGRA